jgi:hypothetical protein
VAAQLAASQEGLGSMSDDDRYSIRKPNAEEHFTLL